MFLGCREKKVYNSGYCTLHGGKRSEKYIENKGLYNQKIWKQIRMVTQSTQPICVSCLASGIIKQTEAIDHVFPHRQDKDRFKHNLFQGLCIPCHTQKTMLESTGVYRHWTPEGVKDYVEDDYNYVIFSGK